MLIALIPFAFAVGAAMASSNLSPFTAWSSSWLIVGGSAQLVAIQLLNSGAPATLVVLMALVIGARHLLYSASVAQHVRSWPRKRRLLGAYFLADPIYALAIARFERTQEGPAQRWLYYAGVAGVLWPGWLLLTGTGLVLAGLLPSALPLTLAAPLGILLLLLPMLKDRPGWVAALVGGAVALATAGLPVGLNMLAGGVVGAAAGRFAGRRHA